MTKKLAPCLWKKPRPAFDRRTLKAVRRWLQKEANYYSSVRERYQAKAEEKGEYAFEIFGAAKAAVALRDVVAQIDLKLRNIP